MSETTMWQLTSDIPHVRPNQEGLTSHCLHVGYMQDLISHDLHAGCRHRHGRQHTQQKPGVLMVQLLMQLLMPLLIQLWTTPYSSC